MQHPRLRPRRSDVRRPHERAECGLPTGQCGRCSFPRVGHLSTRRSTTVQGGRPTTGRQERARDSFPFPPRRAADLKAVSAHRSVRLVVAAAGAGRWWVDELKRAESG
jgi:hypothetical protein